MTQKYKFLRPELINITKSEERLKMFGFAKKCVLLEIKQQKTHFNLF